jgi:hypothetical protein
MVAVGECPHSPVEVDDAVAGFVLGGVPVGLRVGLEILIRDPLVGRRPFTAEGVTEVADFDVGHVLDDADEVRPGGRAGHTEAALAEAVQLPQQRVSTDLEIVTQCSLGLFRSLM